MHGNDIHHVDKETGRLRQARQPRSELAGWWGGRHTGELLKFLSLVFLEGVDDWVPARVA